MSKIQPGSGYGFTSGGYGFTLNASDPFPLEQAVARHPFMILPMGPVGSTFRFQVVSGTLNNLVPEMEDAVSETEVLLDRTTAGVPNPPTAVLNINSSTKESWIYLRAGAASSTPYDFPDSNIANEGYPKVISSDVELTDTDAYGYVLLGKFDMNSATAPTSGALYQYISGSLWGDRIKLGTTTARYYYARL